MNLEAEQVELLRSIIDARLVELKSEPHYWTGRTPRAVMDKALKGQRDVQALRDAIFGKDEG